MFKSRKNRAYKRKYPCNLIVFKGFSEDLITYQPSSYPNELINIAGFFFHLHLKKANRLELLKLLRFYVYNR